MQAHREGNLRAVFLPLAFGAAWKVIDLTLEFALAVQDDIPPNGKFQISTKVDKAKRGGISSAILTMEQSTWLGVLDCYVSTVEYRHSLVHRCARFEERPIALSGYQAKSKIPLKPLNEMVLRDFINLSQLVGEGVINGGLTRRRLDNVNFYLNELSCLGVRSVPQGVSVQPIEYYWMKLRQDSEGKWVAPFTIVHEQMRRRGQGGHFDVCIDLPGDSGRQLVGQCEDLPNKDITIDLKQPPSYLEYR